MRTTFCWIFLFLFTLHLSSQGAPVPNFGKSITWELKGESPSLNNMKGKSVLIFFFQDWCGICNGWSPDMFKQVDAAYAADPKVIIVALKTDGGSVSDARKYISKGASAENWIVGVDKNAEYYKKTLGHDKLFYYVWVKPDGTMGKAEKSGSYYSKDNKKEYVVTRSDAKKRFQEGSQPLFTEGNEFSEELGEVVDLAENGLFLSALKKLNKLKNKEAKELQTKIENHIGDEVEGLVAIVKDSDVSIDKYSAYLSLSDYAKNYSSFSFGKEAKSVVSKQSSQSWLKNEQKAEKAYFSILKKAARAEDAKDKERLKKDYTKFLESFPGTYYEEVVKGLL